jgi:hypothetical protein
MHQIETKWLRWGLDLKYQVWSRSVHGERFCIYAKYNTSWQANLFFSFFYFLVYCALAQVASLGGFLRFMAQNARWDSHYALLGSRMMNSPIFPNFYTQNPNFWGRPMYFQWGASRALADEPIEGMSRLIAQTTRVRELFNIHGIEM